MADQAQLLAALAPVLETLSELSNASAKAQLDMLEERFPISGEAMANVRSLVRAGVDEGWLAPRENQGIRFGRVLKAQDEEAIGIECVHMSGPGPGHTHPRGEIDLCFAVDGTPTFDGRPEGWTVYGEGTWHVPTVEGGAMDILYFLPGGAIRFEPEPSGV